MGRGKGNSGKAVSGYDPDAMDKESRIKSSTMDKESRIISGTMDKESRRISGTMDKESRIRSGTMDVEGSGGKNATERNNRH